MKKSLLIALTVCMVWPAMAQEVDNFDVGPYEVDYKGTGDYKFRLRKGIDLYEFYGLQKDTVYQYQALETSPVKNSVMVNVFTYFPAQFNRYNSNYSGASVQWKTRLCNYLYLDAGFSGGLTYGKNKVEDSVYDERVIMFGLPVELELSNLIKYASSLYFKVGIIPAYYYKSYSRRTTVMSPEIIRVRDYTGGYGVLLSPCFGAGGYVPVGNTHLKIGLSAMYHAVLGKDPITTFENRTGQWQVGLEIGIAI